MKKKIEDLEEKMFNTQMLFDKELCDIIERVKILKDLYNTEMNKFRLILEEILGDKND